MKLFAQILQVLLSTTFIFLVTIQSKGGGLSLSFKNTQYHSKKGIEKITHYATIANAGLFVVISLLNVFLAK